MNNTAKQITRMNEPNEIQPIAFYGSNYTDEEYDAIGLRYIKTKYIRKEAMLYTRKWFDYRRMHPVKATYLFAHHYTAAFGRMMAKRDGEHAKYHRGFKGGDPMKAKAGQNTGFYKARQYADLLGIPYDFFCSYAMSWFTDRLWKRLPKPYHLYSPEFLKAVKTAWGIKLLDSIQVPDDSFYMARGFYEHPDQVAFQHWLCSIIKGRAAPEMALMTYMTLNEYLVDDFVGQYFGEEVIQKAINF